MLDNNILKVYICRGLQYQSTKLSFYTLSPILVQSPVKFSRSLNISVLKTAACSSFLSQDLNTSERCHIVRLENVNLL